MTSSLDDNPSSDSYCRAVASVLGPQGANCSKGCIFPFCVIEEARTIKLELREHLVRIMRRLGSSVDEMAALLGVSARTIYRYSSTGSPNSQCAACRLIHSQGVLCKSDVYTVTQEGSDFLVILNKHRHATPQELKIIEYFVEYILPSSVMKRVNGSHEYWVLSRVELEEAKNFQCMCDALNKYTLGLAGGTRRLQTARATRS